MFSNKIAEFYQSICLKGGRMTKFKGQVASCAPHLGWCVPAVSTGLASVGTVLTPLALSMAMLGASADHAWAANECGPQGPHIGCTTGNYSGPTPISYDAVSSSMRLDVNIPGVGISANSAGQPGIIIFNNGSATGNQAIVGTNVGSVVMTAGTNGPGVWSVQRGSGSSSVEVYGGDINTAGFLSYGMEAIIENAANGATASALMGGGTVTTSGREAHGVHGRTLGTGSANARLAAGTINVSGEASSGVLSVVTNVGATGTSIATMTGGSVTAGGLIGRGVWAEQLGLGASTANVTGGSIRTTGEGGIGVLSRIIVPPGSPLSSTATSTAQVAGPATVVSTGPGGTGVHSISIGGTSVSNVTGGGNVDAQGVDGVGIFAASNSGAYSITVGTGSTVTGGSGKGSAIHGLTQSQTVTNSIVIQAGATVNGSRSGVAIRDADGNRDGIDAEANKTNVNTAGTVIGDIRMGFNDDRVDVTGGSVTGNIYMDRDQDVVTVSNATVTGFVDMGTGNDNATVGTNGRVTSHIYGRDGNDVTTVTSNGVVGGSIIAGTGNDTTTVNGTGTVSGSIFGEAGDDATYIDGGVVGVNVDMGTGNDVTLVRGGTVGNSVIGGEGDDQAVVSAGGVNVDINMGNGNDVTTVSGGVVGRNILAGAGNDTTTVNGGRVAGRIYGEAGTDTTTVSAGSVGNGIDMGTGNDLVTVNGTGDVTGNVYGGLGDDRFNLNGGIVRNTILGDTGAETNADGDDTFVWTAGDLIGGFNGQNGSDTATIQAGANYDGTQLLNGGDDIFEADTWIDRLTINDRVATLNGGNIVNWEVINLNNHDITITDVVTGTINVCNGSTTLGGASQAVEVLGCVSPDTIIVTDTTVISDKIEGAGGADRIEVIGSASVTNTVNGAGEGNDLSNDQDEGDTILINTAGTVGQVDGGDDMNIDDGISGDRITWNNGTITNGIDGGMGSDHVFVNATQYDGTQILDGGDDASSADGMIDELTLQGVTVTANAGSIRNWEVVNLIDSVVTIPDLVTETVNVCNGSTTLSGNSMANDVLGCVSPDTIILTDNTVINNVVEGAGGADNIQVLGDASVTNGVFGAGDGNDNSADQDQGDTILINTAGTVEGVWGGDDMDIADGVSGDRITWSDGTINDGIYGGNGSDLVNVTADQYDGTQILDGGDDILTTDGMIDVLTLDGITATANSGTIRNWELVDLIDPIIEIIDPEIPVIHTCNGSLTLSGTGTVNDVLGCISPDTIIVTDNVDITNVIEGAGGADTIEVRGNADVVGGVFGAGEGQDNSAAADEGDTIVIDTTGTVQGVWGGDDQDIADGVSGDRITWSNGTIVDGIYGGNGSDLVDVTADQYDGTQILDGGDDILRTDGMIDVLTLDGITATANSGTIRNWELVKLIDPEIEIIDPEIPVIHTCNGSLTLSGTGTVDDVLGCISPDTIIVTDNVDITNVIEGAGGADTIEVRGNANVANGVFGAGNGQDNSAAADEGDTIVIDTTGTVQGVWGGDDQNINDGVSGDRITWSNGTIVDGIYGENGSDLVFVTASQYDGTQILDGGDDTLTTDGMIDVLTLDGITATINGGNIRNWEVLDLIDPEIEIIVDPEEPEIPVIQTCNGSITLSGAGSVGEVLGCISPDTIIVTDDVTISDVIEGAGGADTIEVTGNANVTNGIFGAGDGQDNSGDQDEGDTILLDTTGTTAGIWGGDDSDIADGVSGDTITWNNGTITDGIYGGNGSDTVAVNTDDYDGSQKLDGGDDTSPADGMVDDLTLNGLTVTSNGADISNWELVTVDGGELTIDDGRWDVGEPGVDGTGVILTGGGDLEALDELVLDGNLTVDPGSTFIGTGAGEGVYVVTGDVRNAGLITTVDDIVGDTFTVGGDYDGTGGRLEHDVDTSTGTGDKTIIEGDVTGGPTDITVNNITPTTGDGTDIPVVIVGGDTGPGDFTLNGGPFIAGAFVYDLELMQNTWFLSPEFQPATPIYEVYPQVLLALNGLSSNQQRTGGRYWRGEALPPEPPQETVFCKDASQNFRCPVTVDQADYYAEKSDRLPDVIEGGAIWTRIEGAHSHNEPYISDTGAEYDLTTLSVEAGLDALLYESEAGKLLAGVSAHYRRGWANITSAFGNGHIYTQGLGVGANLSWYGANGFYLDAQGQATWYTSDLESDELGTLTEGNDAFGYALSLEAGKRIGLGDHWTLVPQAQLVWSSVEFDTFTGPNGEVVAPFDGESLRGRFGMALEHENSWRGEDGAVQRTRFYGIANVYYEFLDGTEVAVGQTRIARANDPWVGELGIGAQYNWADDKYSIYGELAASTGLKSFGDSYRYRGHLGFRVKW